MSSKAHARLVISTETRPLVPSGSPGTVGRIFRHCPLFRGKARLQEWLVPNSGVRRATIFGCHMELDLSDVIQRDIYAGLYEPYEARYLETFLRPGMTVFDVGANVGYYTWMAAGMVGPRGRVVAFEPGPYAFQRLQSVVRKNRLSQVDCRQLALGDRSGAATLYVPKRAVGNYNPSLSPYLPDMDTVTVSVERLDDVMDRLGIGKVDFMKVDVEGHELCVFCGADRAVRQRRIRAILCEFNRGYQAGAGWSCAELEAWFAGHGYSLAEQFPSKWGSAVHNRLYVAS